MSKPDVDPSWYADPESDEERAEREGDRPMTTKQSEFAIPESLRAWCINNAMIAARRVFRMRREPSKVTLSLSELQSFADGVMQNTAAHLLEAIVRAATTPEVTATEVPQPQPAKGVGDDDCA